MGRESNTIAAARASRGGDGRVRKQGKNRTIGETNRPAD